MTQKERHRIDGTDNCKSPEWHKLNDGKWHHIVVHEGITYLDGAAIQYVDVILNDKGEKR